jgi:hypothetical protein
MKYPGELYQSALKISMMIKYAVQAFTARCREQKEMSESAGKL